MSTLFSAEMLEKDVKNYHVWSYRQWLVQQFGLWDSAIEMEEVERLLRQDVRNNSAWNHRWFLVFGRREQEGGGPVSDDIVDRETKYAKEAIRLAPQNESPWNYLRGLMRQSGRPLQDLKPFAGEFATLEGTEKIRSSYALDYIADASAEEGKIEDAKTALGLLSTKYDPIRANYWSYRKSLLEQQ